MPKKRAVVKLKTDELIEVKWSDASGLPGWLNREDAINHPTADVTSVGYVLDYDPSTKLSISASISEDGQALGVLAIPSGWIIRVRKLK